jgi:hypothetical protein
MNRRIPMLVALAATLLSGITAREAVAVEVELASSDFQIAVGYTATNPPGPTGMWSTSEATSYNAPVQGPFSVTAAPTSPHFWGGGPRLSANGTLVTGGPFDWSAWVGYDSTDRFTVPITAKYVGAAPTDRSQIPNYRLRIEITSISIQARSFVNGNQNSLSFAEVTPGHPQVSPSITLVPAGGTFSTEVALGSSYQELQWDPSDYNVSLPAMDSAVTRQFDLTPYSDPSGVGDLRAIDGLKIQGRVKLLYDATPLSRADSILITKGLQLQALAFPQLQDTFQVVSFTADRWVQSNFTTANFGFLSFAPFGLLNLNSDIGAPGRQWARWTGAEVIQDLEAPYLPSMVSFQYQDEIPFFDDSGRPDIEKITAAATWLASARTLYPDVISYTNQFGSQFSLLKMQQLIAITQPDMVTFDTYPFNGNASGANRSPKMLYEHMWNYRLLGIGGHDSTHYRPIPYGLYLQTFKVGNHEVSDSEMRLNQFAAWAFGFKWVNAFVYTKADGNSNELTSVLFNGVGDASPTVRFQRIAGINAQSRNLGPALVRLRNTDIRFIPGQYAGFRSTTVTNPTPTGMSLWDPSAGPHITSITATNIGNKNDGRRGDVWVGYFSPMRESLDGNDHQGQVYFMIVNGLVDPVLDADVRQRIRLNFDFGTSGITSLQRLSRTTGQVEAVPLVSDGGSLYHLDLTLDGGSGDLFKFDTGAPFILSGTP